MSPEHSVSRVPATLAGRIDMSSALETVVALVATDGSPSAPGETEDA